MVAEKSMLFRFRSRTAAKFFVERRAPTGGVVRHDLVHAGRPTRKSMLIRLERFLDRNPGTAQREATQKSMLFLKYRGWR